MSEDIYLVLITFGAIVFIMNGLFATVSAWQRERTLRAAVKAGGGALETLLTRREGRSAGALALSGALLISLAAAFVGAEFWRGEAFADMLPLMLFALLPGCVYLGAAAIVRRRRKKRTAALLATAGPEAAADGGPMLAEPAAARGEIEG